MTEELSQFPVTVEIPVHWADMDAAGHVGNVVYLRWSEAARVAYLDRLGQDVLHNGPDGAGFILAYQDCKYLFSLTYPDTVVAAIRVDEVGEDRFRMNAHLFSRRHQRLVAIANAVMVTYDYADRRKVPVPEGLLLRIRQLEATAGMAAGRS